MKMRKLAGLLFIFLTGLAVFCLIVFFGGNKDIPSEAEARVIAESVISQMAGSRAGLVGESVNKGVISLHIDVSASMNGYALADLKAPDTVFLKVIEYLNKQWQGRLHAVSSAYRAGHDYPETYEFFRSQTNYFGRHDMEASIRSFSKDSDRIHILVTDSQPWDAGDNPAYEKVAAAISDFLTDGGRCVLMHFRSAYRGYYSSPLTQDQIFYDCSHRPFAVWIFASKGCASSAVEEDLFRKTGDWEYIKKIQFGEPNLLVALADRTRREDNPGKRIGKRIGEITLMTTGKEVGRIKDYPTIRIKREAIDGKGYVPLQFDLTFTNNLVGKGIDSIENKLRVTMECWEFPEIDKKPHSTSDGKLSTNAAGKLSESTKLSRLWAKDLEHRFPKQTNAPPRGSSTNNIVASSNPRLVVSVQRPGKARRYAWVMTIRPKDRGSSLILPTGLSTPDDRLTDQCEKILKLDDMLNTVVGNTEKMGMILFLTEFPK